MNHLRYKCLHVYQISRFYRKKHNPSSYFIHVICCINTSQNNQNMLQCKQAQRLQGAHIIANEQGQDSTLYLNTETYQEQ